MEPHPEGFLTPLEHLSAVEELAANRAEPNEFRRHLIAIRDALELQVKQAATIVQQVEENAKLIETNKTLYLRSIENKRPPESEPRLSSGIIHRF